MAGTFLSLPCNGLNGCMGFVIERDCTKDMLDYLEKHVFTIPDIRDLINAQANLDVEIFDNTAF
jgi:hypothetical protein